MGEEDTTPAIGLNRCQRVQMESPLVHLGLPLYHDRQHHGKDMCASNRSHGKTGSQRTLGVAERIAL